jgi:hypothetical protein
VLDFVALGDDIPRVRSLAFAAFEELTDLNLTAVLERSGAGFTLWVVSNEATRPAPELLRFVAQKVGVEIRQGVCDLYPTD